MMLDLKIICKKGNWTAASGFSSMEKAEKWIQDFDPKQYMDKTLKREDFEIVDRSPKK